MDGRIKIKTKVKGDGQECPSHIFWSHIFFAYIFNSVRARARGSLPELLRGRGGLGFGGCILVCLRNFLAILGRSRTILPARLGRSNLRAGLRFGLMIL